MELVINGYTILDANGGGDVMFKLPNEDEGTWVSANKASLMLGEEYFTNKVLHKMVDDDFNLAMEQCVGVFADEGVIDDKS